MDESKRERDLLVKLQTALLPMFALLYFASPAFSLLDSTFCHVEAKNAAEAILDVGNSRGGIFNNNCVVVEIVSKSWIWTEDLLRCGVGVGSSVSWSALAKAVKS